jgi:ATP/ADP translocase
MALIIVKISGIEFSQTQREMFRILSMNIIILGLSFIACSKDRIEDEMIVHIRLTAMATSFIFAICYVIINPIIDLIFQDPIKEMTGQQLIGSMLGFYLIVYYLLKRKR